MTNAEILTMTKANLEIIPENTLQDTYLTQLVTAAQQMITREGVTLTSSIEDGTLVSMYAAWLYRKRAEDNPPMPRMLRWALNNRVFSEAVSS